LYRSRTNTTRENTIDIAMGEGEIDEACMSSLLLYTRGGSRR